MSFIEREDYGVIEGRRVAVTRLTYRDPVKY